MQHKDKSQPEIFVSAPGRVCMFGEDQDYLGLSVIPAAINRRVYIRGNIIHSNVVKIKYCDLDKQDQFSIAGKIPYMEKRDYIRSAVNVLKKQGYNIEGVDCEIWSEIPISAGLSSSSALVVAWVKFLASACRLPFSDSDIARVAFDAEVTEFGEPGGMMDHFASALGGIFHMRCINPPVIERLNAELSGMVIGNTMVRKNTIESLNKRKSEIKMAIECISKYVTNFNIEITEFSEIKPYLNKLETNVAKRLCAVIRMRDIVKTAQKELIKKHPDPERIGELMNLHHVCMRDCFENSIPESERLIRAALDAGALGAKITGSGNGGCVAIYAPDRQEEVAGAILECGCDAYIVEIDEGVRDEI